MRWISSIGGVIATGAAALVLISLPTDPQVSEPVTPPIETESAAEPTEQSFVEQEVPAPDLNVPELGDGVADVLQANGYTQFVGSEELADSLPDDVVQVLISEEAVLVIPSDEESE
jgi:hypothetical protein